MPPTRTRQSRSTPPPPTCAWPPPCSWPRTPAPAGRGYGWRSTRCWGCSWFSTACCLGAAAGGYGPRLLETLALHGPLELAGFALAGAAYLAARTQQLTLPDLGTTAAVAAVLLLAAAWIETYLSIGADR